MFAKSEIKVNPTLHMSDRKDTKWWESKKSGV